LITKITVSDRTPQGKVGNVVQLEQILTLL
jgi:hypothetical protein